MKENKEQFIFLTRTNAKEWKQWKWRNKIKPVIDRKIKSTIKKKERKINYGRKEEKETPQKTWKTREKLKYMWNSETEKETHKNNLKRERSKETR